MIMDEIKPKLTLSRPAIYQIKVPGVFGKSWSDWYRGMTVSVEFEGDGSPTTILSGNLDQAALQSLLRRLYTLGLPLISVICVDCS